MAHRTHETPLGPRLYTLPAERAEAASFWCARVKVWPVKSGLVAVLLRDVIVDERSVAGPQPQHDGAPDVYDISCTYCLVVYRVPRPPGGSRRAPSLK